MDADECGGMLDKPHRSADGNLKMPFYLAIIRQVDSS